jgi:hypothetical protein
MNGRPTPDVCAGDPWLSQLFGTPSLSSTMRLAQMQQLVAASDGGRLDRLEMDNLYELQDVRSSSAETYEWRDNQTNGETARVTIVRQAFGDPRSLRAGDIPLYGAPITLGTMVLEYPPSQDAATKMLPFRPHGGRTLFTFSDGTWVRVDTWMAQRVRESFVRNGPPAMPAAPPDVAWEICAGGDPDRASRLRVPLFERATIHVLVGRDHTMDMFFRFRSPEAAAAAREDHRSYCAQNANDPARDKGVFEFRPPCGTAATSAVEGAFLHYTIRSSIRLR